MKTKYFLIVLLGSIHLCGCRSDDNEPIPQNEDVGTIAALDTLANHFKFQGAQKIAGRTPAASGGSLKFSIKDTLHLFQGVYFPIKFLHDSTADVTGIFVQVVGLKGGPISSFYFDVPEVPLDNDTVSVVVIRFDPTGVTDFEPPLSFNITIIPHNDIGQPLDEGTIPVKIEKLNDNGSNSVCGLTGGYWKWLARAGAFPNSQTTDFDFYNSPDKLWLRTGQLIGGCCCNGSSSYNAGCPCAENGISNAVLHFSTFLQYKEETLTFFENGTFFRQTKVDTPYPDPLASDFCSNAGGVIHSDLSRTSYEGNWAVSERAVPENLQELGFPSKMNSVVLDQTSQDPQTGGYGDGGGWIATVDCSVLVLVGADPEGTGEAFWAIYDRKSDFQDVDEDDWYDIPEP
jgi:hypothetical protein